MASGPIDGAFDVSGSGEFDSVEHNTSTVRMSGIIRCPRCDLGVPASERVCPNDGTDLFFRKGQILAEKYELIDLIGSGGMGVIYKARHLILDKIVAIKVLHNSSADSKLILRFQREAKAASSLSHSNVITIYDFGIIDGVKPYMVMDYLPGRTLADVLDECGPLPVRITLEIVEQILAALSHAHKKGILHRDLKPGNIMLIEEKGEPAVVKILDFGLAKIVDGDEQVVLSQVGTALGSPAYMSPEQGSGLKVDKRTDLYSLGCIAYELLSGKPPLLGDSPMETLVNRLKFKAPLLGELCRSSVCSREFEPIKQIPTIVELFVAKLLEPDPKDRYQSAEDARDFLNTIWQYVDQDPPPGNDTMRGARRLQRNARASAPLKEDNEVTRRLTPSPEKWEGTEEADVTEKLDAVKNTRSSSPRPGNPGQAINNVNTTSTRDTVKDLSITNLETTKLESTPGDRPFGSESNLLHDRTVRVNQPAQPSERKGSLDPKEGAQPDKRKRMAERSTGAFVNGRIQEAGEANRARKARETPLHSPVDAAARPRAKSSAESEAKAKLKSKSGRKSHNRQVSNRAEALDFGLLLSEFKSRNPQLYWLVILLVMAAVVLTLFILIRW